MSKQFDEDVKKIEEFLASPSPLGNFERMKETEYKVLQSECEYTGKQVAICEYVLSQKKAIHQYSVAKLKAFVEGVELDKNVVSDIEERISNFESDLKGGKYAI